MFLRLRVQDIDFWSSEIFIRDGKGAKDRITILNRSRSLFRTICETSSRCTARLGRRLGPRQLPDALGRNDVSTTMIYIHVLNKGGHGVRNPADTL